MASFDICTNIDDDSYGYEHDALELEVFMERSKLYIRSKLNDIPVFEIDGNYTDPTVLDIIESIQLGTLSEKVLEMFEGCSSIPEINVVTCTIFDERESQGKNSTLFLKKNTLKENVLCHAISVTSPCMLLSASNSTKLCY